MKCVKYLMFIFNLLFFISGLALIIVGALVMIKIDHFKFLDSQMSSALNAAIVLIVGGSIVLIIAFFGCFGAVRENYCMIVTFTALLCLVFVLEIAVAIAVFATRDQLQSVVTKSLKDSVPNYYYDDDITIFWDQVQKEISCCGAENYTDWEDNNYLRLNESDGVPGSCCKNHGCQVQGLAKASFDEADKVIFTKGCVSNIDPWVIKNIVIIGGVAIGLTFLQILGIILASCLATGIRQGYHIV